MRLPPLNAVRAFEAAGRHVSFSRAAEELHVTPGAISRHVKLLEDTIGVQLFHRHAQGLTLSKPGLRLLPRFTDALQGIARAVDSLQADETEIRVISEPTIGIRWLFPRLPHFQQTHPALRVTVGLFNKGYEEFYDGGYDLGIEQALMRPNRPVELEVTPLRHEDLTPVCSPSILENGPPLNQPQDVLNYTLLHPSTDYWDWKKWFQSAGLDPAAAETGQVFDTTEMALRATLSGLGITIGDLSLIREELASGQLVVPFDLVVSADTGYSLLCRPGGYRDSKLLAFRDWLLAEIHNDEKPPTK